MGRQSADNNIRRANLAGAAMLVFLLMQQTVGFVSRFLQPAAMAGPAWPWALRLVFTLSMSGVTLLFLASNGGPLGLVIPLKKPRVPTLVFLPLFLLFVIWVNILLNALQERVGSPVQESAFPDTSAGLVLYFLAACLATPLLEELVFRGGVQGLLQAFGRRTAMLMTTLLFASMHNGTWDALAVIAISLFLCWVRGVSGSVWPCIILHFANNTLSFVLRLAQLHEWQLVENMVALLFDLAFFGSMAAVVFLQVSSFKLALRTDGITLRKGLAGLRGAVGLWAALGICVVYFVARALL